MDTFMLLFDRHVIIISLSYLKGRNNSIGRSVSHYDCLYVFVGMPLTVATFRRAVPRALHHLCWSSLTMERNRMIPWSVPRWNICRYNLHLLSKTVNSRTEPSPKNTLSSSCMMEEVPHCREIHEQYRGCSGNSPCWPPGCPPTNLG